MADTTSQTIYLDSTEEITGVIDRVDSAKSEQLNLVVPKNAVLFQSVVNLKLLKKSATRANKKVVIITRDETGQHLAHSAGLPVRERVGAPLLTKPQEQTKRPLQATVSERTAQVASQPSQAQQKPTPTTPNTRQSLRQSIIKSRQPKPVRTEAPKKQISKKPSRIALLPNLPWKWIGIGAGVLLIVFFLLMTFVFARATVRVTPVTETATVDIEIVGRENPDKDKNEIGGQYVSLEREHEQTVTPSGTKEVGERASGSITINNVFSNADESFGVNTRLQSSDGQVFLLSGQVTVPGASVKQGKAVPGTVTTTVIAENVGEEYNIEPTSFTFIDLPSNKQSAITASSSNPMTGGTKREVKTVTSEDLDKAADKAKEEVGQSLTDEVFSKLENGQELLDGAYEVRTKDVNSSTEVGAEVEGDTVTITTTVEVRGLAVSTDDIRTVATNKLADTVSTDRELLDSASDDVSWSVAGIDYDQKKVTISAHAERLASLTIDEEALKDQIGRLSIRDAELLLAGWPEIDAVSITISPFWKRSIPGSGDKITVDNTVE